MVHRAITKRIEQYAESVVRTETEIVAAALEMSNSPDELVTEEKLRTLLDRRMVLRFTLLDLRDVARESDDAH